MYKFMYKFMYTDNVTNKLYYSNYKLCSSNNVYYKLIDGDTSQSVILLSSNLTEISNNPCTVAQYCPTAEQIGDISDWPNHVCEYPDWRGAMEWQETRCINSKMQTSLCCTMPRAADGGWRPKPPTPAPRKYPDEPDCCCGGCPEDNPSLRKCDHSNSDKPNCSNCLGSALWDDWRCSDNCKKIEFQPQNNKISELIPKKVVDIFTNSIYDKPDVSSAPLAAGGWCVDKDRDVVNKPGPWCGDMKIYLADTVPNCNIGKELYCKKSVGFFLVGNILKTEQNILEKECCELAREQKGKALYYRIKNQDASGSQYMKIPTKNDISTENSICEIYDINSKLEKENDDNIIVLEPQMV